MISISQIEYVLAVDKCRHFGQAAKLCHISQPTLSQQIQKIEDDLRIIIFDRVQKPIVVTPEGQRFINQARIVLKEHQRLLHLTQKGADGLSGEFRLGIIPTISSFLLPLFIEEFSKVAPNVQLYIDELKTETIIQQIKNDDLDGAILATPLHQSSFKEHVLFYEPLHLYLTKSNTLLKKKKISVKQVESDQIWLLQDGNCFKDQVSNLCAIQNQQASVFSNIHFQGGSLDTLKHIVKKTKGVTIIPALMTHYMNSAEIENHVREFEQPTPTREISFIYRRDHWKLEIIKTLEQTILNNIPDFLLRQKDKTHRVLEAF